MRKKTKALTEQKDESGEGKKMKYEIIGEDEDTARWDGMTLEEICNEGMEKLKWMFRVGYEAIKILAYIEMKGRWRDSEQYKTRSFSYFVEDYFGIRAGTYFNMKAIAHRYGRDNFDRWGLNVLKKIEGTKDPEKTLAELNAIPKQDGRIKGTEIRKIIDRNRPEYPENGVLTPWSIQRNRLIEKLKEKDSEIIQLNDQIVALEIKIEQLEDEIKRLR